MEFQGRGEKMGIHDAEKAQHGGVEKAKKLLFRLQLHQAAIKDQPCQKTEGQDDLGGEGQLGAQQGSAGGKAQGDKGGQHVRRFFPQAKKAAHRDQRQGGRGKQNDQFQIIAQEKRPVHGFASLCILEN